MNTFVGVDLGWYGKPSGLASLVLDGPELRLRALERLQAVDDIVGWILGEAGRGSGIIAVDAPLVIRNETGIRDAERQLNADFRRFHAGCHAANLGRPFAQNVISFSRRLESLGFRHGASIQPRQEGRFQIEIHPHAATVSMFGLDRIVKYKRGSRAERAGGLRRLRKLALSRLPILNPPLRLSLPRVPETGPTKSVEDRIDAIMCAYIGAHWWFWGTGRNWLYGTKRDGYIIVPKPPASS